MHSKLSYFEPNLIRKAEYSFSFSPGVPLKVLISFL